MEKVYKYYPDTKTYELMYEGFVPEFEGNKVYYDTETTGLSWRKDKIFMHQIADVDGDIYVVDVREEIGYATEAIYNVLQDPNIVKYIYNAKFDCMMVLKEGVEVQNIRDLFIMMKLYPQLFYGYRLKEDIVPKFLQGVDTLAKTSIDNFFKGKPAAVNNSSSSNYILTIQQGLFDASDDVILHKQKIKKMREKAVKKGDKDYTKLPNDLLIPYAGEDIYLLRLLDDKIMKTYDYKDIQRLFDLEHSVLTHLMKIEQRGCVVDTNLLNELKPKFETLFVEATDKFYELSGKDRNLFNVFSSDDLRQYLYTELKMPIEKWTKNKDTEKRQPATTKYAIELMDHPIAPVLLELSKYDTLANTFIPQLLSNATEDGTIHASFNQLGAVSGRLSCSEPNLENIPKRGEGGIFRKVFKARPGFQMVSIDASQIEYRIYTHYLEDQNLIKLFEDGEDFHANTAGLMYNKPASEVTKEERNAGKTLNFGLIYGMGAKSLADSLHVTLQEAETFRANYFARIPKANEFLRRVKVILQNRGYVKTILGRKRFIQVDKAYTGINAIVQGTAADIFKLMIDEVMNYLEENNLKSSVVNLIHDELLFEIADDELHVIPEICKRMEGVIKLRVPIKVEVKIGPNWMEMKKYEEV